MAKELQGVIFDWAGTTVDFGSMSPVAAFMTAFEKHGIAVTEEETRAPMGMLKRDHIRTMLAMPRIAALWQDKYGRAPTTEDIDAIYSAFEPSLYEVLPTCSKLKPFVPEAIAYLRALGLKIGSTTGYTSAMMEVVTKAAAEQGYIPDCMITADDVGGFGRPFPYMLFENMRRLGIMDVRTLIKLGDTRSDIEEAKNAGVFAVGICTGSSVAGLSEAQYDALSAEEKKESAAIARAKFYGYGADFVINDLSELDRAIEAFYAR